MLAPAHFEYMHLVAAPVRHNLRLDRCAGDKRRAESDFVPVRDHQNLVDDDFGPNISHELFDFELGARCNAVLLAAGFYDRIHDLTLFTSWLAGYGKPNIIPNCDF